MCGYLSLSCSTASPAAMDTAYRESSWLPPLSFPLSPHASLASVFPASLDSASRKDPVFTRLPRHNSRIHLGDTQRRLPTWRTLLTACFLLDDASRSFYDSYWFGTNRSHVPALAPFSSCPQHRLHLQVKAPPAPPPFATRSQRTLEERWGLIVFHCAGQFFLIRSIQPVTSVKYLFDKSMASVVLTQY